MYAFSSNKDIFNPVVSNYLINEGLLDISWPDNHNFAACLTHDVDSIYPSWKYVFFTAIKCALKLKPAESLQRLIGKIKKDRSSNPYWNFKNILQLEERYGGKSSFYFKATSRDTIGWIYDVDTLKDELGAITDMGGEVGLHGGYYSYNDPKELKKEKDTLEKALGKNVIGIRMHYLRFSVPDTWRLLADLGFKYDTTFGYSDMPGFRNGMAHPFRPYDMYLEKEINILEIPLVIMDGSLFKMPLEEAWTIIKKLIDVTEKNKGVITILWHNTTFDEIFWNGWTKLYEKILQLLKERNAWMTSGEKIYNYWAKNKTFKEL
jgi:peptidoglycan/xylan/chitin deacetylase (PgdA/CDA1 family)